MTNITGKSNEKHRTQMRIVYRAFRDHPKTMLMVSEETGILRANICRYVAFWRKKGLIQKVKSGLCFVSLHPAAFHTTNPELFDGIQDDEKNSE